MRLARLVAAGLAVGVVIGFVAALLRPRPGRQTGTLSGSSPEGTRAEEPTVLDIRSQRPVTG